MKKYRTIIIIFCSVFIFGARSTPGQAQTSLEFNQVLLVSNADTVPPGKVWKITNFLPTAQLSVTTSGDNNANTNFTFTLNGQTVYLFSTSSKSEYAGESQSTSNSGSANISPMWIPAGHIVAPGNNILGLSIIEFNVVP